jgi:hypothetical protein
MPAAFLLYCQRPPKPPARRSAARDAETAAPNKTQFNGVGGLRAYIGFTRIFVANRQLVEALPGDES